MEDSRPVDHPNQEELLKFAKDRTATVSSRSGTGYFLDRSAPWLNVMMR